MHREWAERREPRLTRRLALSIFKRTCFSPRVGVLARLNAACVCTAYRLTAQFHFFMLMESNRDDTEDFLKLPAGTTNQRRQLLLSVAQTRLNR